MKCIEAYHLLLEELDEHLDEPSRDAIKHHLEHCTNCTTVLRSVKKTIALYKAVPELQVSNKLTNHILETIKTARKKPAKSPRKKAR